MSILDKAKKHYKVKMSAEPRQLYVKEWDETVYIKPGINLQHLGEIMQAASSGKSAEAMALTLIYRIMDEEGKPLFKKVDKLELMRHVDPDVMAEIVNNINENDPDQEDAAGN
jgi:Asp-tRNA(Asn)/Glu-tRNA(Gln) amidotransferase B subunit